MQFSDIDLFFFNPMAKIKEERKLFIYCCHCTNEICGALETLGKVKISGVVFHDAYYFPFLGGNAKRNTMIAGTNEIRYFWSTLNVM